MREPSDDFDSKSPSTRMRNPLYIRFVRGHDYVASSPNGSFDDGDVDDVLDGRASYEFANPARLLGGHLLNLAASEHAVQACLTRTTSPSLGQHRGWHHRDDLFGDEPGMKCPHTPVVAFPGDQSAGVVGDAGH